MSYLNQISRPIQQQAPDRERDPNGEFALPPVLPGQYAPRTQNLPRLRLRQLQAIARAWGIDVDPNGTKPQILPILEAAEMRGVFNQPPKNKYYFHVARYNSDQIKEAKAHGGFLKDQYGNYTVPCDVLYDWNGDDPEADRIKPGGHNTGNLNKQHPVAIEWQEMRTKARQLGINTWGKSRDQVAELLAKVERGEDVQVDQEDSTA